MNGECGGGLCTFVVLCQFTHAEDVAGDSARPSTENNIRMTSVCVQKEGKQHRETSSTTTKGKTDKTKQKEEEEEEEEEGRGKVPLLRGNNTNKTYHGC